MPSQHCDGIYHVLVSLGLPAIVTALQIVFIVVSISICTLAYICSRLHECMQAQYCEENMVVCSIGCSGYSRSNCGSTCLMHVKEALLLRKPDPHPGI